MARRRVKVGKKKQQSSKPKAQKTKMSKPSMKSDALMRLSMGVCSVSNPFCPEAVGARWPDNSMTKSVYWGIFGKSAGSLTSDASGNGSTMIIPDFGITGCAPTGGVYPTQTYGAMGTAVTFPSNVGRYRLTTAGIRITSVVAPLSASGTLRIRLFSPMSGSPMAATDVTTLNCDDMYDIPVSRLAKNDLFVNFASLGDVLARQYRTPPATGPVANWVNPGWQIATVAVDGCVASTSIVQVYLYFHYELIFDDSSATQMFATAPPSNNLAIQQGNAGVFERVGNFIEGTAQKVDSLFKSKAFQFFASAAATAYGGPQAGALTYGSIGSSRMIKDVD